jgi:hypothetical protein
MLEDHRSTWTRHLSLSPSIRPTAPRLRSPRRSTSAFGTFASADDRAACHTFQRVDALFEWECPTWGCRGLIAVDAEPDHDTRATCIRPRGSERVCGREMAWDVLIGEWLPTEPFRGFR